MLLPVLAGVNGGSASAPWPMTADASAISYNS